MYAAKHISYKPRMVECMLPNTFRIKPINLYSSYKKREDQLS